MFQVLEAFKEQFNNYLINPPYKNVIKEFKCYLITESIDNLNEIEKLPNKSQIITIDKRTEESTTYFYICFDKAIIIVSESKIISLSDFFNEETNYSIIINASEEVKDDNLLHQLRLKIADNIKETEKEEYKATIDNFIDQMSSLKNADSKIRKIWTSILPCISTYIINKSYKLYKTSCIDDETIKIDKMNHDDFIPLQLLSLTNSSRIQLIYHIEREQLLVLKHFYSSESRKLFEREYKNYNKIKHPSIPRFYGRIKIDENDCLIIEYISGTNLVKIDKLSLDIATKINAISEIMAVIEYLQNNFLIYRDLKPSNFILDSNDRIKLIDFDRMIFINEQQSEMDNITTEFNNIYQAPEVLNGTVKKYTLEEDVYSIGLLIYFIFLEKSPQNVNDERSGRRMYSFHEFPREYSKLRKICEECTQEKPEKRPKIAILFEYFMNDIAAEMLNSCFIDLINNKIMIKIFSDAYKNNKLKYHTLEYHVLYTHLINVNHKISIFRLGALYYPEIFIKNKQIEYHDESLCYLFFGLYYYDGRYTSPNIKKAMIYLSMSANRNNTAAQFNLGVLFYEGKYIKKDINKSIHYFSLASKQYDISSQYNLGMIYSDGKEIPVDIDKAVYYYTLAAEQNYVDAQFMLGYIFNEGVYVTKDVNKAIHYFTLAANQNNVKAQFNLGLIYSDGHYAKYYINKAIYYYTLAANQNYSDAQCNLGHIYLQGKYVARDASKAIHYFTLASNLNNVYAQINLGFIYYDGNFAIKDTNKAIHYFTCAANQNNATAQYVLGFIYFEGKIIKRDIKKAISYYTLAANQNHVSAQYNLGFIYYSGELVARDIQKAVKYLTLAANQNSSKAQHILGYIYYYGNYIKKDINKAIYYLTLAADNNNDPESQYNIGLIYYDGRYIEKDINKAIYYLTLASNQNNSEAQCILGCIYYYGNYIEKDINKAIHYLKIASDQNHTEAQICLGSIYCKLKDIDKAIYYFNLAAEKNCADAQYDLGMLYCNEKFIQKDINKAIDYFTLAAKQNHADSQCMIGIIYNEGNDIPRDINKAMHYFALAVNQNHAEAQNRLGLIYYKRKDINKAINYLTLAANQNHVNAQSSLGYIYYNIKDINKAIHYFLLAANQGDAISQFYLALIYYNGEYIQQDMNKAILYASLASKQDNPEAQYLLGIINIIDINTKQSIKNGIDYLILASKGMLKCAHFYAGFIFHEGKYVDQDIKRAIHFYKEGSSFNDNYSKNNLGVIFRDGFGDEIEPNIGLAIEYFTEAINQKNDIASMYNLANIYIYDDRIQHDLDKSIDLLIKSLNEKFHHSYCLFVIALIKKVGLNLDLDCIIKEIDKYDGIADSIKNKMIELIKENNLLLSTEFEYAYNAYKNHSVLYDFYNKLINNEEIAIGKKRNDIHNKNLPPSITQEFYEGFGIG